jgi:hypothetical protein
MNLKTTTLRQLIKEDFDKAFDLGLYLFCDYEHIPKIITTEEFVKRFNPTKGYYGPYIIHGIHKGLLDIPLYLGE